MKQLFPSSVLAVSTLLFCNCSSTLSEKQKAAITQVTVAKPAVGPEDFQPASGTQSPGAANGVPMATGGGALPALIGLAIDAGVTAHQASEFKKQYGAQLDEVNAAARRDIGEALRERGSKVVKNDPFFGPKLATSAPYRFDGELVRYGLVRFSRSDDQTYLGAEIVCNVWLADASGKKLFTRTTVCRSEDSHTIHDFAAKKSLVNDVFKQAADQFESQFKAILDQQLGR
ncbi:hypothetical protein [Luteolibacter marinus]|uniref:hypothetical protein n=1 Tax=Luteolibacter marinus TaxID=2776705 RepID=UPI001865B515|nr:hypothetical protein [Luteolibacter marinus]